MKTYLINTKMECRILFFLTFCLLFCHDRIYAQVDMSQIKQQRAEYISKQLNIGPLQAQQFIEALDNYVANSNKIYNDTTLNVDEKNRRLLLLREERAKKIHDLIPDITEKQHSYMERNLGIKTKKTTTNK